MSLRVAPLLYVFYETASIPRQRALYESALGLPVIENQFHPPHEYHGLVKYDAGQIILSLNLAREARFAKDASDGLTTVLAVDSVGALSDRLRSEGYSAEIEEGSLFTDAYGHHYLFYNSGTSHTNTPSVRELRLTVRDFDTSLAYYGEILDLALLEQTADSARFATGTVDLVIQRGVLAPDGRPPRYTTYLIVFYTRGVTEQWEALKERGLVFKSHHVVTTDIGDTMRFIDPSGHTFCLYEPSEESLAWGSGAKVREIITEAVGTG
jgi:predicted enzyme related to lactoylglutathione lyase